ncbi:putative isomerase YbhE [Auricularia subglabra TFB-10046 SS5]|nr:putative isomerase YbhE [Auricularia subglabra TFB-10046 SS5]
MVSYTIFAGTYAAAISVYSFDSSTSKLTLLGMPNGGERPGWLQLSSNKKILFATQETTAGGAASFLIGTSGTLTQKSRQTSARAPSLAVVRRGREVVVGHYDTGSLTSFPVAHDGYTLGPATPLLQFEGSGPDPERQLSPHPHHIVEYGEELLVPDLGSDKVWRLTKNAETGGWEIAGALDQVPGSGPRHAVAEDGKLYVVHELDNTLTSQTLPPLPCHRSGGPFTPADPPTPSPTAITLSSVSIVPTDGAAGASWHGGEIAISPRSQNPNASRFLYASNRNVGTTDARGDPICVTRLDRSGRLTVVQQAYTGLFHVRGMALGGDRGQYIIAAGMDAGGVAIFERDEKHGTLKLLDRYAGVGSEQVVSFAWL